MTVRPFIMSMSHRCLPLERSFVVLVMATGVLLFLMATMLFQHSQYDLVHQYLAARRAYAGRHAQEMSETSELIKSLSRNGNSIGNGNNSRENQATHPPVTDPPWMGRTVSPVKPFVPGNKRHPFLRGYVLQNPKLCRNASVDLLIIIHSAVANFQRRRILRETWAATDVLRGLSVRTVFLLGRNGSDRGNQVRINTEQASFGDVVQGDFQDTFLNLTLKAVMALRWVNDHCSHARFVLKADDDVFVNVLSLAESYLQRLAGQRRTVMCHIKAGDTAVIIRDPRSKWFVAKTLLPGRTHWPEFCSGYLVVMTTDVVPGLYRASFSAPYISVDDGFVYGVLPALAGEGYLRYIDISRNLTLAGEVLLSHYRNKQMPLSYVGGSASSEEALENLWQAALVRLSPWAKTRSSIARLRSNIGHRNLL